MLLLLPHIVRCLLHSILDYISDNICLPGDIPDAAGRRHCLVVRVRRRHCAYTGNCGVRILYQIHHSKHCSEENYAHGGLHSGYRLRGPALRLEHHILHQIL